MLHALLLLASGLPAAPARPLPLLSAIGADRPCPEGAGEEVVVCGRRGADERYRLPLRHEAAAAHDRPIGEQSRATRDLFTSGPCGIFAGQRRCDKAEAAAHGYGGGRDPVTTTAAIVSHLLDPND